MGFKSPGRMKYKMEEGKPWLSGWPKRESVEPIKPPLLCDRLLLVSDSLVDLFKSRCRELDVSVWARGDDLGMVIGYKICKCNTQLGMISPSSHLSNEVSAEYKSRAIRCRAHNHQLQHYSGPRIILPWSSLTLDSLFAMSLAEDLAISVPPLCESTLHRWHQIYDEHPVNQGALIIDHNGKVIRKNSTVCCTMLSGSDFSTEGLNRYLNQQSSRNIDRILSHFDLSQRGFLLDERSFVYRLLVQEQHEGFHRSGSKTPVRTKM